MFQTFNKMKEFAVETEEIAKAVGIFSTILALNETKDKVRRTTPIVEQQDCDERTVYLVRLDISGAKSGARLSSVSFRQIFL